MFLFTTDKKGDFKLKIFFITDQKKTICVLFTMIVKSLIK
jgi:hypothetical protein